jgi:hypothetical protein
MSGLVPDETFDPASLANEPEPLRRVARAEQLD